jgi:DNA-binding transcriptional regulator YhcF (GntR family)
MKFWFAAHSDVPLYRQLVTQVVLAIVSGDLRAGDRLPSTRELARRFAIHPNTVSAGYRQLEHEGWTELRHGSGVFVCTQNEPLQTAATKVDAHIHHFFRSARELGLPPGALRARLAEWLAAPPPDHWLLVDPDPELRRILLTELRSITTAEVRESSLADCCTADTLKGAIACCRPTQSKAVRAALPAGTELVVLPITSANQWLTPWVPAPKGHLIAVASHWPEFLAIARTMLAAAAVPADALIFCDARKPRWQRGLGQASGILCDAFTATLADLPRRPQVVVFPLLAADARDTLRQSGL